MKKIKGITVQEFFNEMQEKLRLDLAAGKEGMQNLIRVAEVNRPGLALAGYFDYFARHRVQVLGKVEITYTQRLSKKERTAQFRQLMEQQIPTCIVARHFVPPPELLEVAEKAKVPIFRSPLITMHLVNRVTLYLEDKFAPTTTMNGNLLEVFGVGVLILGKSGVGKSECALSLIKRGHRLVADDVVKIKLEDNRTLIGCGSTVTRHHMEIRGLGIINVQTLFGAGCVRDSKRIDVVISLEEWDAAKEYERLGLEDRTMEILGVDLSHVIIPVRPGRDIGLLVETASLNQRLKWMGLHSARDFNKNLMEMMQAK